MDWFNQETSREMQRAEYQVTEEARLMQAGQCQDGDGLFIKAYEGGNREPVAANRQCSRQRHHAKNVMRSKLGRDV